MCEELCMQLFLIRENGQQNSQLFSIVINFGCFEDLIVKFSLLELQILLNILHSS